MLRPMTGMFTMQKVVTTPRAGSSTSSGSQGAKLSGEATTGGTMTLPVFVQREPNALVLERPEIRRTPVAGHVVVGQAERRLDVLDGLLGWLGAHPSTTRKHAMSRMLPTRSPSGFHTASTRAP